jgi:hypothetical protein
MPRGRVRVFRLTDQRRRILRDLVRYRYLRTTHFYNLLSAGAAVSTRAVRRLLHDLHAHGFLGRRVVVAEPSGHVLPHYEHVYWLLPSGVALAGACGFCDDDFPLAHARSQRTLTHDAAVRDVHLAVEQSCGDHGRELYWQQHRLKRGVNPDALFALTDPSRSSDDSTAYYFLELERWREAGHRHGRSALVLRLHRYANYQGSSECRRDWQRFDEFRVNRTGIFRERLLRVPPLGPAVGNTPLRTRRGAYAHSVRGGGGC